MEKIAIDLERRGHRYDILLQPGLCRDWRGEVAKHVPADSYLVMVDACLAAPLGLSSDRPDDGWRWLPVEAGESNKTFGQFHSLAERALALGLDRKTVMVAIGGGVTGDMSGFVAACLLRGIRLVMIPTTLLAMVDSSVGGKNGINTNSGKNLVGTFHQPELVLIDPAFLDTLPRREYLAGLAEVAKTAILDSREFFFHLRRESGRLLANDHDVLADVIARCCRVKAAVVAADEKEKGARALLNLGHTFGHALEALAGYDGRVVHGEAVAVGTALAAAFAVERGWLDADQARDIVDLFFGLELPVTIGQLGVAGGDSPDWPALLGGPALSAALLADKKAAGGLLTLVLPHGIGDCRVEKGYHVDEVAAFMRRQLSMQKA